MTQYMKKWSENDPSDFIVRTCQLLPKSCRADVDEHTSINDSSAHWRLPMAYSVNCGSTEEFYILPLKSCIDDTDVLEYEIDELAFAGDFPVLPNDLTRLGDTIKCYRIERYIKYPGFVRPIFFGKMNYDWRQKKYEFVHESVLNQFLRLDKAKLAANIIWTNKRPGWPPTTLSGPAITYKRTTYCAGHDTVRSVWCPEWPKEAHDWPTRPRCYGWPTTNAISEVVRHGCHVVYVQHRACRDDAGQWRLSFSVAEVILLQSWTKIQQIVYHLLRFFAKRELIQKDCPKDDEIFCTYHIKTLMLWACEYTISPERWDSSSVISICSELLNILSEWLKMRYCPNYFIPEANLFHELFSPQICERIKRNLDKFCNSRNLCDWFVENYILPFTRTHIEVTPTENTKKDHPHFMEFFPTIVELLRKANKQRMLNKVFETGFVQCNYFQAHLLQSKVRIKPRSGLRVALYSRKLVLLRDAEMPLLPMPENISCFTYFHTTLFSLHAACALGYGQISWESELFAEYFKGIFMIPKFVRCQYHIFPKPVTTEESMFQFLRAQDFMEDLTGSNSRSEHQLMSLLSKELLRNALKCDDCQSSNVDPAIMVYLAALHSTASENQIVSDLCSIVLMDETNNKNNELLNAGCLFFIDDVVRIVGLCLLCEKLSGKMEINEKQIYLDLRLTPKVFAYYLTGGISAKLERYLSNVQFSMDKACLLLSKRKFPASVMSNIFVNTRRQCIYRRKTSLTEHANLRANRLKGKEIVIDLLFEYAFENMTLFYNGIHKDFGIQCNTVDCYRALYLYKCRRYDEALQLCERILHKPDLNSNLKDFTFANVLVTPLFDCFFDEDVQFLLGFQTLFLYLLSFMSNGDLRTFDMAAFIAGVENCKHYIWHPRGLQSVKPNYLLGYPLGLHSVKHNYFLKRHFLAQYLKLRCFVDCKKRYAEAMNEFATMKICLPFESTIRHFILRKLHPIQNNSMKFLSARPGSVSYVKLKADTSIEEMVGSRN